MGTAIRAVCSIAAGLVLAIVLVMIVELISAVLHQIPEGFTGTQEEMCEHVARYPFWVLAIVVVAWGGTAFASTWVASRIGNQICGVVVGLILVAAVAFNVSMLPYSLWFKVVILLAVPVAAYLGIRASRPRKIGDA
jgi:hypothetical protein